MPKKRFTIVLAATAFLIFSVLGLTQTTQKDVTFEVASVKAVDSSVSNLPPFLEEFFRFHGGPGSADPGRIEYSGVTMRMLVRRAYSMRSDQIAGPGWIDKQRYRITANVPAGSNDHQVRLMLRSLLAERFQIQLHREKKTMSIYALVVAPGGHKLQPAEIPQPPAEPGRVAEQQSKAMARLATHERGQQRFHSTNASVSEIINFFSMDVDQPVLDRTQLQGKFSLTLSYYHRMPGQDIPAGPSVFEAVKTQLGLELIPTKDEVELLMVDRANRLPTSNE